MPWEKMVTHHNCSQHMPNAQQAMNELNASVGSIYKCDAHSCDKRYILKDNQKDGYYWELLPGPSVV